MKTVTLCGWLFNPSPANWSLIDANAEWILSEQGGHSATGWLDSEMTNHDSDEWVYLYPGGTPSYGYGCACLDVVVDDDTNFIMSFKSGSYQKLAVCRTDPNLPSSPYSGSI